MAELEELARATTPEALDDEVGWLVLRACHFNTPDVEWRQGDAVVTIDLACGPDDTIGTARPKQIAFHNVEALDVEEEYEFDGNLLGFEYRPAERLIEVEGFPALVIRLRVSSLDVRVYGTRGDAPVLRTPFAREH